MRRFVYSFGKAAMARNPTATVFAIVCVTRFLGHRGVIKDDGPGWGGRYPDLFFNTTRLGVETTNSGTQSTNQDGLHPAPVGRDGSGVGQATVRPGRIGGRLGYR